LAEIATHCLCLIESRPGNSAILLETGSCAMIPSCIAHSTVIGWHGTSLSHDALRALRRSRNNIDQGDCQSRDALCATEKKVCLILDRESQSYQSWFIVSLDWIGIDEWSARSEREQGAVGLNRAQCSVTQSILLSKTSSWLETACVLLNTACDYMSINGTLLHMRFLFVL